MPVQLNYRVVIKNTGTLFAPGTVHVEFENPKNVGYSDYINDVPEAFFTIAQNDPKISLLRNHKGDFHVLIYRNADLVFAGYLGEHDANENDVIFYAYGYLAELANLHSDWGTAYTNAQIDTIVSDAWTRAKTTLTSSRLAWVTTGTIQAPVTTTGGGTAIVLPAYEMYYKNTLQLFREMAALGISDTANVVKFEITQAGTFNFWKAFGTGPLELGWRWPHGIIQSFRESYVPIYTYNDVLAVGMNPNSLTLRDNQTDATHITNYGRRQTPAFFSWVRDNDELVRATKRRLKLALREDYDFMITFKPGTVLPAPATGCPWDIGETVYLKIDEGVTNIGANVQMIAGYQTLWIKGKETTRILLQERPGV